MLARRSARISALLLLLLSPPAIAQEIGREVAVETHLQDGAEFSTPLRKLVAHGATLFSAVWTPQEGGGRPLTKGTGAALSDAADPLLFPRNFNRISAPDANSCAGCHNTPAAGGGGDIVANVFVLGQRFDFLTFDPTDTVPTRGAVDEDAVPVTLQTVANSRNTLGMFGSGYIEMLARQITADLQATRDGVPPGGSAALASKGISFGTIARNLDGTWDTSEVDGLAAPSLTSGGAGDPPNLIIRPFHQAGAVISLRQFTNNALNHHHGVQPTERFGTDTDPDGDGFTNEVTRADVTALTVFQATLGVPGRLIPRGKALRDAVRTGEERFVSLGCAECHIPSLPLDDAGWRFTEPNPYNPTGNLRPGDAEVLTVNLNSRKLPGPRLRPRGGVVEVQAFTDFKLHDITSGAGDPNVEPLDMQEPAGSGGFFAGNAKFITRKLWGCANEPPFMHHGQYTTLREAILAHAGEALASRQAFEALPLAERDAVVEFLKTLQVLPPGTKNLLVDDRGRKIKKWPAFPG
jgi:cytochrome c peroxidase